MQRDHELARRTMELAAKLRETRGEGREDLQKQLEETVGAHFEVRQQGRKFHAERLEQELTRLRESIEQREALRGEMIRRRMAELTGQPNPLEF